MDLLRLLLKPLNMRMYVRTYELRAGKRRLYCLEMEIRPHD